METLPGRLPSGEAAARAALAARELDEQSHLQGG